MPSSWPMVMTPVPPTPATTMPQAPFGQRQRRLGQRRQRRRVAPLAAFFGFFSWPPSTVTKLGQKPFTQRVVLVAGVLVDAALAAELGLQRLDRQAVALHRAVAAAFAHQLVDDHALGRVDHRAALAAAALLGGAGLVVDDDGDARDLAQLALHVVELVAVVHGHARREAASRPSYFSGSSVTTTMLAHALGVELARSCPAPSSAPSTGWPPVIATASLKRIL